MGNDLVCGTSDSLELFHRRNKLITLLGSGFGFASVCRSIQKKKERLRYKTEMKKSRAFCPTLMYYYARTTAGNGFAASCAFLEHNW